MVVQRQPFVGGDTAVNGYLSMADLVSARVRLSISGEDQSISRLIVYLVYRLIGDIKLFPLWSRPRFFTNRKTIRACDDAYVSSTTYGTQEASRLQFWRRLPS